VTSNGQKSLLFFSFDSIFCFFPRKLYYKLLSSRHCNWFMLHFGLVQISVIGHNVLSALPEIAGGVILLCRNRLVNHVHAASQVGVSVRQFAVFDVSVKHVLHVLHEVGLVRVRGFVDAENSGNVGS